MGGLRLQRLFAELVVGLGCTWGVVAVEPYWEIHTSHRIGYLVVDSSDERGLGH